MCAQAMPAILSRQGMVAQEDMGAASGHLQEDMEGLAQPMALPAREARMAALVVEGVDIPPGTLVVAEVEAGMDPGKEAP